MYQSYHTIGLDEVAPLLSGANVKMLGNEAVAIMARRQVGWLVFLQQGAEHRITVKAGQTVPDDFGCCID